MSTRRDLGIGALANAIVMVGLLGVPALAGPPLAATPDACLEAHSSSLDAEAWPTVFEAITVAVEGDADFFPDAVVVSEPDLAQPWLPNEVPTVKIGIWSNQGDDPASAAERRDRLAVTDCLVEGASWTTRITEELLLAGAERILAGARLPDETGEPPIREDAEASISVGFHAGEQHVRTTLEFSVPALVFRLGGTCWIDDVLSVDTATGQAVTSASAGMDVDPFVESGCEKFQGFMTEGGAGEQALSLLPAAVNLADGKSARFVTTSVELRDGAIVLAGDIDTGTALAVTITVTKP